VTTRYNADMIQWLVGYCFYYWLTQISRFQFLWFDSGRVRALLELFCLLLFKFRNKIDRIRELRICLILKVTCSVLSLSVSSLLRYFSLREKMMCGLKLRACEKCELCVWKVWILSATILQVNLYTDSLLIKYLQNIF